MGLSVEISKIGKRDIKGVSNFATGVVLIIIWLTLYITLSLWIVNIFTFFLLLLGLYGIFKGLLEIIYSIRKLKSEKEKKAVAVTDMLLLMTYILGLILVAIQIVQQM